MVVYELITGKTLDKLYGRVTDRVNKLGLTTGQFNLCTDTPLEGRQLFKLVREYTATLMYDKNDVGNKIR